MLLIHLYLYIGNSKQNKTIHFCNSTSGAVVYILLLYIHYTSIIYISSIINKIFSNIDIIIIIFLVTVVIIYIRAEYLFRWFLHEIDDHDASCE